MASYQNSYYNGGSYGTFSKLVTPVAKKGYMVTPSLNNVATEEAIIKVKSTKLIKNMASYQSKSYNGGSYGVFTSNVDPVDAYKDLYGSSTGEGSANPNEGRDYSVEEAQEVISGGNSSNSPAQDPETTPSTTTTVEKKWYEKLFEDKVKVAILAAAAAVIGWLIFKKD